MRVITGTKIDRKRFGENLVAVVDSISLSKYLGKPGYRTRSKGETGWEPTGQARAIGRFWSDPLAAVRIPIPTHPKPRVEGNDEERGRLYFKMFSALSLWLN